MSNEKNYFMKITALILLLFSLFFYSVAIGQTSNYPTFDTLRLFSSPLLSPPFPGSDWGYNEPLIGLPEDASDGFLQKLLGMADDKSRIKIYGWVEPGFNLSTSQKTNIPVAYDIIPNSVELNQAVLRIEREPNTVQTDHFDWGFRLTNLYGEDYHYTNAKGWINNGYFKKNNLYGYGPIEFYGLLYFPKIAQGMIIKIGRFISPPDIESALAVSNYLYTHSALVSYDADTYTGIQATFRLSKQVQLVTGIHAGNDVAPWDKSASLHGQLLLRWVSRDENNGLFGGINSLGDNHYRDYHDNKQAIVVTWGHRFDSIFHMQTEAYYQWQYNGATGGSASFGPVQYDAGGGPGMIIPGINQQLGMVNYFQILLSRKAFLSLRNEIFEDVQGQQTGFRTSYLSHTLGLNYFFTPWIQMQPEIRYDWNSTFNLIRSSFAKVKPYDASSDDPKSHQVVFSMDMLVRF